MPRRHYYSVRHGKNPLTTRLDLATFKSLFLNVYLDFDEKCFFQESFGYHCVDVGYVRGSLGMDIGAQFLRSLRKQDIWPIRDKYRGYTEDDLFDVIEFLFDNVSKPVEGTYHSFSDCGWHYSSFDKTLGRNIFRDDINELLTDYGTGFELSDLGEILSLPDSGLESLVDATLPDYDIVNVTPRVNAAKLKFRRHRSSLDDRRDAIRDLADVLEFMRPKLRQVITKSDEADLFNIANNFGVRHHNESQKSDYDTGIWHSWMFYYYLATIHAAVRLIQRDSLKGPGNSALGQTQ